MESVFVVLMCLVVVSSQGVTGMVVTERVLGRVAPKTLANRYIAIAEVTSAKECEKLESRVASIITANTIRSKGKAVSQKASIYQDCFIPFEASPRIKEIIENLKEIDFVEAEATMVIENAPESWGLDRIDQRELPLSRTRYDPAYTGSGVSVYVLDTGIYPQHTTFNSRAHYGGDFVNEDTKNDANGHGTHCAGTVGGDVYGVATGATIIGVKVLNARGSGSISSIIRGVEWVVNHHSSESAAVVSMSLGGGQSSALNRAISRAAGTADLVFVVAAGNSRRDACDSSPAMLGGNGRVSGIVTVGATTETDGRSDFSNFGSCLDIFAPGSNIKSAWIGGKSRTRTISGTSMATPHVAGALAQLLQKHDGDRDNAIAELFSLTIMNRITDAKPGSPNLLLQVPIYSGPPTPPTPQPTFNPTASPDMICVGDSCSTFIMSSFGPKYSPVTGQLAVPQNRELCDSRNVDASNLRDKIVLVRRGACLFYDKVIRAQKMGAVAVIIYLHRRTDVVFSPGYDGKDMSNIQSMMISYEAGRAFSQKNGHVVTIGRPNPTPEPTTHSPTTKAPSQSPTTFSPSLSPTSRPTKAAPTSRPTKRSTPRPTSRNRPLTSTNAPTKQPTNAPTKQPTNAPCDGLRARSCRSRDDCEWKRPRGRPAHCRSLHLL